MSRKFVLAALTALLAMLAGSTVAQAQFKREAFSQNYDTGDTGEVQQDTSSIFSLKMYFRGLSHKSELKMSTFAIGSAIFVGGGQIYNRDYKKLPVIYGGLAGTIGAGVALKNSGHKEASDILFGCAGALYWGTMLDAVIGYKADEKPHPGKATMYSLLCPGMGQIYNGEAWKVPVYWGMLLGAAHFYELNKTNYNRYRRIYLEASDTDGDYSGPISASTAQYYRNLFRRYRDYSAAAFLAFYLIQVIDANVFAFMQDFQVSDDISMSVRPSAVGMDSQYAMAGISSSGIGLSVGLRF